jgi:hypothetical protein
MDHNCASQRTGPAPQRELAASFDGHLTPAVAGWHFWSQAECRTAGFAAADVLPFGDTALSEAAAASLHATDAAVQAWDAVRQMAKARIYELSALRRCAGQGRTASPAVDEEIARCHRALKQIKRRRDGEALALCLPAWARAAAVNAEREQALAEAAFRTAYARAVIVSRRHAAALAGEPRLREAITWQNRRVLRTAFEVLLRSGGIEDNAATRRASVLLAAYVQRYTTKNDTIGFFGPVGWARFENIATPFRLVLGERFLARRYVYFEDWAIRAYADRLSANPRLRPWKIPRRVPHLRLEDGRVFLAGRLAEASTDEISVLAACDGVRTARAVSARLLAHPLLNFEMEEELLDLLDSLAARGRIDLHFEVRVGDAHPERHLRIQLQRIDEPELREAALGALDMLERARAGVAAAAGDAERLYAALDQFDACFEALCATPATRNAGLTYGARTPLYEDCLRDMQLTLGTPLREALQTPLSLVLQSARWFCHVLSRVVEAQLDAVFDSLSRGSAEGVDFAAFWLHAQGIFFSDRMPEIDELVANLSDRWARVLGIDEAGATRIVWSSEALREQVVAMFDAPEAGWGSGCHQSPDVVLYQGSADALTPEGTVFVLGELHAGINTLLNHSAHQQHPEPDALMAALQADLQGGRVIPLLSREGTRQPVRVQVVTDPDRDTELCFSPDVRPLAPGHALTLSDLVVNRSAGRLVAQRRQDGRIRALCDVFGQFLSGLASSRYQLLPPYAHLPRVSIDKLVVQRETWRFACGALPFVMARSGDAFLAATRWRQRNGLPRLVFVRAPWETKPFYVDLDSPLFVAMLEKQVRNELKRGLLPATEIVVSEMLPTPDHLWLTDSAGRQYTSELRIVAIHEADRHHERGGWQ